MDEYNKQILKATHYLPNKGGQPQMYYKYSPIQFNDGSKGMSLQYLSHCDIWMGSSERNIEEFIKTRLVKIEGTQNDAI